MKKNLLLLFVMLVPLLAIAKPISVNEAQRKAAEFILGKKGNFARSIIRGASQVTEVSASLVTADNSSEGYFVFNLPDKGGYIVVSGDDRMPAVLGYSDNGAYDKDNMPENMKAWMDGYSAQYAFLQANSSVAGVSLTSVKGNKIYPRLSTKWGQEAPYNDLCPEVDGEKCVTGCVATALSQIMNYHQWPAETTKPIPAYTTETHKIKMAEIGISTIDWDNMISDDEMAKLVLMCGNSVRMDYDTEGSASVTADAKKVLVEYFDYKDNISIAERKYYKNDQWNQMIYDELYNDRPVIYSGQSPVLGGHAFIVDGYDGDDYFHINWGWNGGNNGNFILNAIMIDVGGGNYVEGFNNDQYAIIGIEGKGEALEHKYAYAIYEDDGTLTFYYDDERESREGTMCDISTKWHNNVWGGGSDPSALQKVVFDPSFADYKGLKSTAYWFYNCTGLTTVEGMQYLNTENVTSMRQMFAGCQNVTELDVSNFNTENVEDFYSMFYFCQNITELDVSKFNTKKATDFTGMFYNCSSLVTIYGGDGWDLSDEAGSNFMFGWCESLVGGKGTMFSYSFTDGTYARIDGGAGAEGYFTVKDFDFKVDNIRYNFIPETENQVAVTFRSGNPYSGDISIPSSVNYWGEEYSVTAIDSAAFADCFILKSVTIPETVVSIGESAFSGCTILAPVTIPNGVTAIEKNTFRSCTGFTSMIIPESVKTVGEYAFDRCLALTSVTLSDSTTSIGNGAFYNCSALTEVIIPDSVTSIGERAFFGCLNLADITFPDTLMSLGSWAFYSTAWYNSQSDGIVYAGRVAYTYKTDEEVPEVTSIELKDSTRAIADFAFFNLPNLMSVTIPDSVVAIGKNAFALCNALTEVNIYATVPPTLQEGTFSDYSATLHVMKGYGETYAAADYWRNFTNIVDDLSKVAPGDANGDGKVSIADVTTVASYLLGDTPEGFNPVGADANEDGNISIADVTTIASMLLE